MNLFNKLAVHVENLWAAQNNDLAAFTNIATKALTEFKYDWPLEKLHDEIQTRMLKAQPLPEQINVYNTFGQPPLTLFNNGRFVVDIYFWVNFDTAIHSHGFRGAFKVLQGESLQETFGAKLIKELSEDIRIVDMKAVDFERLQKNDVRTIAPGTKLTHRVIHLENPTVTLCVKTINEPQIKQWTYLSNGLAMQRQTLSPDLIKKIYFYQYLMNGTKASAAEIDLQSSRSKKFLAHILSSINVSTQIHLYEAVASGALALDESATETLAEAIVERHDPSEWWSLYEAAHLAQYEEFRFEDLQKPLERLVAHFHNCGYNPVHLITLTGASQTEIAAVTNALGLGFILTEPS